MNRKVTGYVHHRKPVGRIWSYTMLEGGHTHGYEFPVSALVLGQSHWCGNCASANVAKVAEAVDMSKPKPDPSIIPTELGEFRVERSPARRAWDIDCVSHGGDMELHDSEDWGAAEARTEICVWAQMCIGRRRVDSKGVAIKDPTVMRALHPVFQRLGIAEERPEQCPQVYNVAGHEPFRCSKDAGHDDRHGDVARNFYWLQPGSGTVVQATEPCGQCTRNSKCTLNRGHGGHCASPTVSVGERRDPGDTSKGVMYADGTISLVCMVDGCERAQHREALCFPCYSDMLARDEAAAKLEQETRAALKAGESQGPDTEAAKSGLEMTMDGDGRVLGFGPIKRDLTSPATASQKTQDIRSEYIREKLFEKARKRPSLGWCPYGDDGEG